MTDMLTGLRAIAKTPPPENHEKPEGPRAAAMPKSEQVIAAALKIIKNHPQGIRADVLQGYLGKSRSSTHSYLHVLADRNLIRIERIKHTGDGIKRLYRWAFPC